MSGCLADLIHDLLKAGLTLPHAEHPLEVLAAPQIERKDKFTPNSTRETLELVITSNEVQLSNYFTKATYSIRQMVLKLPDSNLTLPCSKEVADRFKLTLVIQNPSEELSNVELPEGHLDRIREYLVCGPPWKPFDCTEFLYWVQGSIGGVESKNLNVEYLPYERGQAQQVGEGILLRSKEASVGPSATHVALSLGHGLYLSKFGDCKALVACTLDAMMLHYEADQAERLIFTSLTQSNQS